LWSLFKNYVQPIEEVMKKNKTIFSFVLMLGASFIFQGCEDDEKSSVMFEQVYASYDESSGTGVVNIPLRVSGSVGDNDIAFDVHGSATEGEDFNIQGWTREGGLAIEVLNDAIHELPENVTVRLLSESGVDIGGNQFFELTIVSDCDYQAGDVSEYIASDWKGDFAALENYGPNDTYGPYTLHVEQSEENPNRFEIDNFWDSGIHAYMIIDPATGTISFPSQGDGSGSALASRQITGSGQLVYDGCNFSYVIVTKYRGTTFNYEFTKL
jgi:hypothetical protein